MIRYYMDTTGLRIALIDHKEAQLRFHQYYNIQFPVLQNRHTGLP